MSFYHGSSTSDITKLIPQIRFTPEGGEYKDLVYLTPSIGYACCHAFPWSSDEGFDLDANDETGELFFEVPSKYKERLNSPIYIYEVEGDSFKEMKGSVFVNLDYISNEPIKIKSVIKYNAVLEGLQDNGVNLEYLD